MKIIIDTEELSKLKEEAGKLQLTPDAESTLARILELETTIAEIKEAAKMRLIEEGKKLNPNFKSWEADTVKVSMKAYGTKYYIKEADINLAPPELFKTEVTVVPTDLRVEDIMETIEGIGYQIASAKTKDGTTRLDIKRSVDSKAVDKFVKQNNGMPAGIGEFTERPVSVSISFKEKEEHAQA